MKAAPETKAGVCLGCGRPLPPDRLGPNSYRVYHDDTCRRMHEQSLAAFNERSPELPGWGRSPVPSPGAGNRLRVVSTGDGRLAVRFDKGPAKKLIKQHHDTDTLPMAYYLVEGATVDDAAAFLQKNYPEAEVVA